MFSSALIFSLKMFPQITSQVFLTFSILYFNLKKKLIIMWIGASSNSSPPSFSLSTMCKLLQCGIANSG